MLIKLIPIRDSHNSHPSETVSAVEFSSDDDGARLHMRLPDGRELTFDGTEIGKTLRALDVVKESR